MIDAFNRLYSVLVQGNSLSVKQRIRRACPTQVSNDHLRLPLIFTIQHMNRESLGTVLGRRHRLRLTL